MIWPKTATETHEEKVQLIANLTRRLLQFDLLEFDEAMSFYYTLKHALMGSKLTR